MFLTHPMNFFLFPTAWLAMKASGLLLPAGRGIWRMALLYLGHFVLVSMVIFLGDPFNLPPTLLFFMAAVLLCCKGPLLQRLTIGLMFASTALALNAFLDETTDVHFKTSIILRLCFWCLLYLAMRRAAPPKDYELSPALWKLLLLLTLTPLGITCSLVLLISPFYISTPSFSYAPLACLFIAFLSFVGLLWAITVLAKQRRLERDSIVGEMNKRYYASMEQQQFEVRRLRHDLSNHLQALASLPDEEKDAYLAKLIESPAIKGTLHYCGDQTVNAVLSTKAALMEQKNISFDVKADIPGPLPFEKADICALLANALDNAAEACQKLPQNQRRTVLRLRAQKGIFAVSVINPLPGETRADGENALPDTSKADKEKHGFGLRSIREVVTRYQGSMDIQTKNGEFQLFLYMPLDQEQVADR